MSIIQKTVTLTNPGRPANPCGNMYTAFDSSREVLVTFGGLDIGGLVFADTEEYNPETKLWQLRQPLASPQALCCGAATYDPDRKRFITFGGFTDLVVVEETNEYDGTVWVQRSPATVPPKRGFISDMPYDTDRKVVVLFGGIDEFFAAMLNDLHEYDGTDWTLATPVTTGIYTTPPSGRASFMAAYDPIRKLTVVVGGTDIASVRFQEIWLWDGTGWRQQSSAVFPAAEEMTGELVFIASLGKLAMIGGNNGVGAPNRTWLLDENGFEEVVFPTGATLPPDRANGTSGFDGTRFYLFGGATPAACFNDLWAFDGQTWLEERTGFEFDSTLIEVDEGARLLAAFSTANPTVRDATGVFMDGLTSFSDNVVAAGLDSVQYAFEIDGVLKWFNAGATTPAWETSDGTFAQSNLATEVNTNASTFPLASAGSLVRFLAFLHSDDGSTTPELEAVFYTFDPAEIVEQIRKAQKTIRDATGIQPTGLMAHLETFKEMGIDAKKYGEHRGGGVYWVKDQPRA